MAQWTKILTDFDAEDETINFGTRNFAETNKSIYETWTLATIQSEIPVKTNPKISASIVQSNLCVVIDKSITIFDSESCQKVLSSIGFDSLVTTSCLSTSGELLFIAIQPAVLYCFNLHEDGQQLLSIDFYKKFSCKEIVKICLQETEDAIDGIIFTSNGKIFKIPDIQSSLSSKDESNADNISTNCELITEMSSINRVFYRESDDLFIIAIGNDDIYVYPDDIYCRTSNLPFEYTKIQFFNGYSEMIGLRNDGKLSVICPVTLLGTKVFDGPVVDFVTLNDKSDNTNLLVLMAPEDSPQSLLHLMSFPDFKIVFTMPVASTTYLIDVIGSDSLDFVLVVEGMKNSDDIIDTIRIKAIDESLPEDRLQRLLRQKRFKDAQEFAKKYSLNSEYIFQAEISILLQRLCVVSNVDHTDKNGYDMNEDLNELITAFDRISDIKFIYECCQGIITITDYHNTKRLFEYVKQRILAIANIGKDENDPKISGFLRDINETLRRIETFECIQNTKSDDNESIINDWSEFSKTDLLHECAKYLSIGNLHAAALIWTRHAYIIIPKITKNKTKELLDTIPSNLTPNQLLPWLQYFIPSIILFTPAAIDEVIQWGCNKSKALEQSHRENWPEIGLKFVQQFIELLSFEEHDNCLQINQQYINKNSKFHRILLLSQALTDLLKLKVKYKIIIPFHVYQSEPISVITLILNKIHIDGIADLMKNFLDDYMISNSLDHDQAISKYIKNILSTSKQWWIGDKAPWDKRLTIIVGYINNIEIRLQRIIDILRNAPVPWSDNLVALAKQSNMYDSPLVSQVSLENSLVAVKLIRKKYGFAQIGNYSNLYNNIIKQNYPSMIDDLLELTKSDNSLRLKVFCDCVNYYLDRGDRNQVINILDQLNDDLQLNCCQRIIDKIRLKLNSSKEIDESLINYCKIIGVVERRLRKILSPNSVKFNETLKMIPLLKKLYSLRTEFNVFITFEGYHLHKENILIDFINNSIRKKTQEADWFDVCKRIERFGLLLGSPKFYGIYQLLKITQQSITIKDYLFTHFNDCFITFSHDYKYLNEICSELVLIADDDAELAVFLKKFYPSILTNCDDKQQLVENLSIASKIEAYNVAVGSELIQQNQLTAVESVKLCPIYTDVLSLTGSGVLLGFFKACLEVINYYKKENSADEAADEQSNPLIANLSKHVSFFDNEHYSYSLFKILSAIQVELGALHACDKQLVNPKLMENCVARLLKDVLRSRIIDVQLGFVCLLLLPEATALKTLIAMTKHVQSDSIRDRVIHNLGYRYCRLKENHELGYFENQKLLCSWAQRLAAYGISFKEILQSDSISKKFILQRIMKSKNPEVIELLQEFCENFSFDYQECLLDYLKILLYSWEPKYKLEAGKDGAQNFIVDKSDVKELTTLCTKIINKIKLQNQFQPVSEYLNQIIPIINFYHYEILIILLQLSKDKKIDRISYLFFLQNYTRISEPTDLEKEAWEQFCHDDHPLPEIAKWRLPFLPEANQYKLIEPELNLNTYQKWLKIAAVLKIPAYSICTIAVKGSVAETWLNKDYVKKMNINSTKWAVQSINSSLLDDIKKCIDHMKNEDLEYKAAVWYYVVSYAPPGADQVEAAKQCYYYAQQWQELDQTITPTHTKLMKIQQRYQKFSSKHILYTYGLGDEKYLILIQYPEKLVRELYKDESIPKRFKGTIKHQPDINSAVNELGKIFPLNLTQLRVDLLNEWLQPEGWDDNKSDDNTMNIYHDSRQSSTNICTIDDNLLKACYIVQSGDTQNFVDYLIGISFGEETKSGQSYTFGMRFRALQVVQSLMDENQLLNYIKGDKESTNKYMKTLQYLAELEKLGMFYSVSAFENCPKQKLVELLLNSHFSSPRTLGLVPQIYIDFNLGDLSLLNLALTRMVKYSLHDELKNSLLMLGSIDGIAECDGYISGWQIVVENTFNKLDFNPSEKIVNNCIEMLKLLQVCPVADKLNFTSIVEHCIQVKQSHFAVALVPFFDAQNRNILIQNIKENSQYNEVVDKLMEFRKKGIFIVMEGLM